MKVQSPQIRMLLSYLILTGIYWCDVNFQFIMGGGKYKYYNSVMLFLYKTLPLPQPMVTRNLQHNNRVPNDSYFK